MNSKLLVLKDQVSSLPKLPGVYLMKDSTGETLYVGKAKDLFARVSTYTNGGDGREHIFFLMEKVCSVETIVCTTEQQAIILEWDLIRRYKPRYNIRLKDDKAYYSIRIDENAQWPRLQLTRKIVDDGATYFGPYPSGSDIKEVVDSIQKILPLRTCTDTVFYNRVRPCLEYQIKRCAGPCCLNIDKEEYRRWVADAKAIINGKVDDIISRLEERMQIVADNQLYEEAANIRDRIQLLKDFSATRTGLIRYGEDQHVFGIYREGGMLVISLLKVKNGRITEGQYFPFTQVLGEDTEIIESAVEQYYTEGIEIPQEVILPVECENTEFLKELIERRNGMAPEFIHPQRGVKSKLLGLANVNARQHFISTFNEETKYSEASTKLARTLKLKQIPRRIECIDISNFQGSDIVGAIVVFFDGVPQREEYKKYIISNQSAPDDFGSIYEVVIRRLRLAIATGEFPDLLLVDGGLGQLNAACRAREELGINLEIASLAKIREFSDGNKKPERLFREGFEMPIELAPTDDLTLLVTKIRDEVHRFVITFHRTRRNKRVFGSILDNISGLGKVRKEKLLKQFGSVEGIGRLSADEIVQKCKLPLQIAERVLAAIKK